MRARNPVNKTCACLKLLSCWCCRPACKQDAPWQGPARHLVGGEHLADLAAKHLPQGIGTVLDTHPPNHTHSGGTTASAVSSTQLVFT